MNRYPLWKYLLLLAVLAAGVLYALPNVFGQQPAVQVSLESGDAPDAQLAQRVERILDNAGMAPQSVNLEEGRLLALYQGTGTQLKAAGELKRELGDDYVVALNLAPSTPEWLRAIGAEPMALGLDLRGGVHFLMEVDMETVFNNTYDRYARDVPRFLRDESIRYTRASRDGDAVRIEFPSAEAMNEAEDALASQFDVLEFSEAPEAENTLVGTLTETEAQRINDFALEQNLTTLRNRVNELGVAEPIVQRQGESRIVVELPGVQDTAEAKRLLGKTATLEYRLVARGRDAQAAERTGNVPEGTELYHTRDGQPILLQEEVIASGDQLVDASSGIDQQSGSPAVFVTLDGQAASNMFDVTSSHVGDPMAVLFTENKINTRYEDGEEIREREKIEEVISVATINGVFGKRFQTTGLGRNEAHDLALLLRAGALAAPVNIVEERTIGPSLGADNIAQGRNAVIVGFLLVIVFMAVYYRGFGLFANAALIMNLILVVALLSLLQATLTLPGIAGIVLTIGMAVDANVLIFERIREELDGGNTPQSAIKSGYDKAFSSIADANITTLIAAVVLFGFGTGPVKGFAVTLSLGILTSMFTAIVGTRAIANLVYGRKRRLQSLSI
ncbi:preprotein translocase subunit SecD [Salinisphaera orenii MK-B5]|uniref:Protein translocase subunit SecD n=2 Tax=Salinisphaera orenii TaxID=856731 RepID=A0A423PGH6_9GAMM|nr:MULTISPECIES: protein translocase subunit SecD [Salinisphaera]ROO24718.1 preprotein translocase subunit SecD [Salinisphaera orenii MK-B5]ROO33638.1 preprotein translocase subunit SecD [Salinisphaera halophila YIM 95161]